MDLNHFKGSNMIVREDIKITNIIDEIIKQNIHDQSFYVCNVSDVITKYEIWQKRLPRVKPFYAVKCNNNPTILKILAVLGLGFDCATKSEIDQILSMGVEANRIIFAHTIKPSGYIGHAVNVGVKLMTFDNEAELYKIKKTYPEADLLLRIKYDAKKALGILGTKFGCDAHKEATQLLRTARNLNLNITGVSFHVGFGCEDPKAFHGAIATSRYVFEIAQTLGYHFKLLDIGGGFPGDNNYFFSKFADIINTALEEYFPEPTVEVIAEPGTFFVRSAFSLACNIISVKCDGQENEVRDVQYSYYLSDGIFGSFNFSFNVQMPVIFYPLKKHSQEKSYLSKIFGSTCANVDKLIDGVYLPKYQIGDWLIFKNMGAYAQSACSLFNGIPFPNVFHVIATNDWKCIKERVLCIHEDFLSEVLNGQLQENINIEEAGSMTFYLKNN